MQQLGDNRNPRHPRTQDCHSLWIMSIRKSEELRMHSE